MYVFIILLLIVCFLVLSNRFCYLYIFCKNIISIISFASLLFSFSFGLISLF